MIARLTATEKAYLHGRRLGRLATVDERGAPQVVPVGFFVDESTGQILIGGTALGASRKFRNVRATGRAAFVVDDMPSTDPWVVRGVEIRGEAEALSDVDPPMAGMSRELIRITPDVIRAWGLES